MKKKFTSFMSLNFFFLSLYKKNFLALHVEFQCILKPKLIIY